MGLIEITKGEKIKVKKEEIWKIHDSELRI